jgi:hypothetical protein
MRAVSFGRDGEMSYGLPEGDETADVPGLDAQFRPARNGALAAPRGHVPPPGSPKTLNNPVVREDS